MTTFTHPDAVGMDPKKLEQVQQLFYAQIERGLHPGAGLAVYRYGHLVLDIHGGVSDVRDGGGATQPVTSQTMFVLMSSTKPLAAACLYLLKERGQLAWDDPVATYWPEFGQHGKTTVTVRHVLTHRGGFPETPKDLPPHDWPDWSKVTSAMERAPAVYTPGETIAYHPINYGWVIAELVRRIDGRPFDRFLAEELTAPLGMEDTYVGLPQGLEDRVSPMRKMEADADPNGYSTTFSLPVAVHAVVPGAGGVASAGNLARFYAMLERRGSLDGSSTTVVFRASRAVCSANIWQYLDASGARSTRPECVPRAAVWPARGPRRGAESPQHSVAPQSSCSLEGRQAARGGLGRHFFLCLLCWALDSP